MAFGRVKTGTITCMTSVSPTVCPILTTTQSKGESQRPSQSMGQSRRTTWISPTFNASSTSSQRQSGLLASLRPTPSTPTTTSSKLLPSSLPSVARATSIHRHLSRHARGSLPQSSHTGLKRPEKELLKMENSGHRPSTGYKRSAATAPMTSLATTLKVDGLMKLGPLNLISSTSVVDPSNSPGTTITEGSQMSSLPAPTTASFTYLRTQT